MASTASQARPAGTQPDYEPPEYPLDRKAQRALQDLIRNNNLAQLSKHLAKAADLVTDNVHSVNITLHEREAYVQKYRNKLERDGDGGDAERTAQLERHLDETRARAERMTQRMEESMRKIIDGEHGVQSIDEGLKVVASQAVTSSQQFAQSQRSTTRGTQAGAATQRENEDEDMPDFDPTDPGSVARGTPKAPVFNLAKAFRNRMTDDRDRYQTHSLSERYTDNARYSRFKANLHDAMFPGEDAPPAPHKSTWFNEGNVPAPGETAAGGDDDSDNDIAVARERISTKCPLTLREFDDVVTSMKCPHSFERSAILSLMGGSSARRETQCPVPGCGQKLRPTDLHVDQILVRKIRRIQKSRRDQMEEDELATSPAQGCARRAQSVASDSGEDIDDVERRTQTQTQTTVVPKREPRSSVPATQPHAPRRSSPVDVSDDEEEEEDHEAGENEDEDEDEGEEE